MKKFSPSLILKNAKRLFMAKPLTIFKLFLLACLLFQISACEPNKDTNAFPQDTDWAWYLGGPGTNHYSPLAQINVENVSKLRIAWRYYSGDRDSSNRSQIQCNPLIIDGILFGTSPKLKCFALNAATGEELWVFDPFDGNYQLFGMGVNRGLAYWSDGLEERLLYSAGAFLYAIDAKTGKLKKDFGAGGKVDLHNGLGRDAADLFIISTSPGIVYKDLLIMGSRVSESMGAAPGHIRAYNIRSGKIEWIFHTIPLPGEFGNATWPEGAWQNSGGANAWSGMSLDEKRGWVFVPTGSASFDFYGGDREGDNLFANCVIALNASTGKRIWHYQTVHHDLWDRDLPCPPNLVTVERNGKKIDAIAQVTKSAYIFLLDRQTGQPLFPVEERPVPASQLKNEKAAATQPIPTKPPPFARQRVREEDLTTRSPKANAFAKAIWENSLEGEPFIPPSEVGTFIFPGFDGGGEWGGAAVDPQTNIIYINASEMPWVVQMVPYIPEDDGYLATQGKNIYNTTCMRCHGLDLEGASIFQAPSLIDLNQRMDEEDVAQVIQNGKGMMPATNYLSAGEVKAVVAFLFGSDEKIEASDIQPDSLTSSWSYPYLMTGYHRFKTPDGYPAIKPPWGTLNAINLNTGEIVWKIPFGEYPELSAKGIPTTGSESYGGPVVTAGGLVFIAATPDEKFRAFDKKTGKLLWETKLPAAGYATPSIYAIDGKQYVVVAAGGGKLDTKSGDVYLAFALSEE